MGRERILEKATKTLDVSRHACGKMSGDYGVPCVERSKGVAFVDCMIQHVLGKQIGHGARVRVTVEVLKRGRLVRNPWLKGASRD